MFGTLGGPELLLILVIALIVFGPKKLPEMGKSLGKMMAEFRKASTDFKRTLEEEVEADKMREMVAPPRLIESTVLGAETVRQPNTEEPAIVAQPAAETVSREGVGTTAPPVEPK
jgi:Tat protein translocase TatB subunit